MYTTPIACQKCGSWEMVPIKPAGLNGMKHRVMGRKLYQCNNCRWRGYFAGMAQDLPIFWIVLSLSTMALISWFVLKY